jgi:hypothetical protein
MLKEETGEKLLLTSTISNNLSRDNLGKGAHPIKNSMQVTQGMAWLKAFF